MHALGWLRCLMRLERLRETEGVSVDGIYAKLKRERAGALSGVRSLISTSFVTLFWGVAGLPDNGVPDCCCTCCIAAWYAVAAADILGAVESCSGTPSGVAVSAIIDL